MAASRPPNGRALPVGLMVAGSEMAGFTVLGVVLDLFAFDSMPWCTVGLTLLGCVAAFAHLVAMVKAKTVPPAGGRP